MKHFLLNILFVIIIISSANAQKTNLVEVLSQFDDNTYSPIIYASFGFPFAVSSKDFEDAYNKYLKGGTLDFHPSNQYGVGIKFWISEKHRIGLNASFLNIDFWDEYYIKGQVAHIYRYISNSFDANLIPIFATYDFIPYDKQFRSYIGGGLGLTIAGVKWFENVYSTYEYEKRKSGNIFKETIISPSVKIHAGVELGFDKNPSKKFLGSFFFEFDYYYSLRKVDIFRNLESKILDFPEELKENYELLPGQLSLNLGLTFNLTSVQK